jgi:hypothetical protein
MTPFPSGQLLTESSHFAKICLSAQLAGRKSGIPLGYTQNGPHKLKQKDLAPLFGSESIVSEILNRKRELNKHQIEKLSRRFNVSPIVFF